MAPNTLVLLAPLPTRKAAAMAIQELTTYALSYPIYVGLSTRVEPDPLGDINSIVRLMRRNRDGTQTSIKAALYPIHPDDTIKIGHGGGFNVNVHAGAPWQIIAGGRPRQTPFPETIWTAPTWYVEVNGKRIIEIPEHLQYEPPPPAPRPPWHHRARTAIHTRMRSTADRIAARLGYTPADECYCEDE